MSDTKYQNMGSVGKCIYCGAETELTSEFIIPPVIEGMMVLREARCRKCSYIISKLESDILNGVYDDFIIVSRSQEQGGTLHPDNLVLNIETNDGERKKVFLPPEEQFPLMVMVEYLQPGLFTGRSDTDMHITRVLTYGAPEYLDAFTAGYNIKSIIATGNDGVHAFSRFLCKIAYASAVALYSSEHIEENYLVPYILGERSEGPGNYVGTAKDRIFDGDDSAHIIQFFLSDEGEILARIKLFAALATPEYQVLVGRLKRDVLKNYQN